MPNEFASYSAVELCRLIESGNASSLDVVSSFLAEIESSNDDVNAMISVSENCLETAKAIDNKRSRGQSIGPLCGIPIAVKDGICTKGLRTTAGSKMLETFVPPYNATSVDRLELAGGIVLGKSNLDEFAMGGSTERSYFKPTLNPWSKDYVPGGSSGGSAACVAGTMAPLAIGSDTGGSIRQPASFCGITGLKPTYGRVSRYGLIAFASSLDQIGPMAWTAEDCALLLSAVAGYDPRDSTSANVATENYLDRIEDPISGLKLGVCTEHFGDGLDSEVEKAIREAIDVFADLGADVKTVSLPHSASAVATYYIVAPCEASSNLARYDGVRYTTRAKADSLEQMYSKTRAECFGTEVQNRIMLGTYALSSGYYDAYYLKASKVRRLIKNDFDAAFEEVDLIVGPTTPTPAFELGSNLSDPISMYLADIFTVSANLAGIPAISIPCGFSKSGLPIGLQLQGRPFAESTLLSAGHQFQKQTDFHQQRPSS
ncbi:MAG: Asp-tRNA(Asn)/Glu-tRNA(Gln) amidotransferase subunit GatA [Planctomycetota bacterium]